jgi:hypothetical protein
MLSAAAGFVYSADTSLSAEHAEIDVVLVDAVAKAGGAHGERHDSAFDQGGPDAARCKPKAEGSEWP